jgi:hypothetical protein
MRRHEGEEAMVKRTRNRLVKTVWAYAYQIVPPQSEDRLRRIRTLLDQEHWNAERRARVWAGRVLHGRGNTYILVVSDSPRQTREVNRRLEAKLKDLKATFGITASMSVTDAPATPPPRSGQLGRSIRGIGPSAGTDGLP